MQERFKCFVAVFLVLMRENNGRIEILLQKRYNTGYMDGKYDMAASGHLEKNESLSMAIKREAKEEIGIDIEEEDLELISIYHPYKEDYLNVFFTTKEYKGIPTIMEKDKCDDLNWFDIEHLPENTMERIQKVIKNIKNKVIYDDDNFLHQK